MTPYEKIKKIIECGHIAQGMFENEYVLFSSITRDGDIRCSYLCETSDECFDILGVDNNRLYRINKNITNIKVYQKPIHYFQPGDKVEILKSIKDNPKYNDRPILKKSMIGGPYEIEGYYTDGTYRIYTKDKKDQFCFDPRHIAPRLGDDEEKTEGKEATITIDGIEKKIKFLD